MIYLGKLQPCRCCLGQEDLRGGGGDGGPGGGAVWAHAHGGGEAGGRFWIR